MVYLIIFCCFYVGYIMKKRKYAYSTTAEGEKIESIEKNIVKYANLLYLYSIVIFLVFIAIAFLKIPALTFLTFASFMLWSYYMMKIDKAIKKEQKKNNIDKKVIKNNIVNLKNKNNIT